MEYINQKLSEDLARKIIGNQTNAIKYLLKLHAIQPIKGISFKTIRRGKNIGEIKWAKSTKELWQAIVSNWDYEKSKEVIRQIFQETEKYQSGKEADQAMATLMDEWKSLNLGDIAWPFSQGAFDDFVQRVNAENESGILKDEKVKNAAVKYRRIKEINTVRNDFIETLIFEKNHNILPTLNHRRGVDFFIDGISFDQKVAKSPTDAFKREYGKTWRTDAIDNPKRVAEYLYTYQDEGRFGNDPRLLVVYIDEDVSIQRIREIIQNTNLDSPLDITFCYKHKVGGEKTYKVPCFIILLHH